MTTTCTDCRQPFSYTATPGKPVRARCPMCSAARPIVARRERLAPGEAVKADRQARNAIRVELARWKPVIVNG